MIPHNEWLAKTYGFKNITNPELYHGATESYIKKRHGWYIEFGIDKLGLKYLNINNNKPNFIKRYPKWIRRLEAILKEEGFYR